MNLTEVKTLAEELMDKHLGPERMFWHFDWMNQKLLGYCSWRDRKIYLNEDWVLASPDSELNEIKDTILHEIAHVIAGCRAGHSRLWQMTCLSIGARPERCGSSQVFKEVIAQNAKYVATCPTCKTDYHANRLTSGMKRFNHHCSRCNRDKSYSDKSQLRYRINY